MLAPARFAAERFSPERLSPVTACVALPTAGISSSAYRPMQAVPNHTIAATPTPTPRIASRVIVPPERIECRCQTIPDLDGGDQNPADDRAPRSHPPGLGPQG